MHFGCPQPRAHGEHAPVPQTAKSNFRFWRTLGIGTAWCALVATLGCATQTPVVTPSHEHWVPAYVFGVWGKAEFDVRDDCPTTGARHVRIGQTWSTLLVGVLTLGMYTPTEVTVRCREQP